MMMAVVLNTAVYPIASSDILSNCVQKILSGLCPSQLNPKFSTGER